MIQQIIDTFVYGSLKQRVDALEAKAAIVLQQQEEEEKVQQAALKAKPSTSQLSDLTAIKGIGKRIAEQLNEMGISSVEQLARLSTSEIENIKNSFSSFRNRIERDNWIGQAQQLSGISK